MSFSRRKFLRSASLLSVSALFPIRTLIARTRGQSTASLPGGNPDASAQLNHESFARCLNSEFVFARPYKASAKVKLIEVNDLTPPAVRRLASATGRECFATVYIGSQSTPLPQETYTVTHASLGTFDMFIVPIGKSRQGVYYEAIFNRLHG